MKKLSKLKVNNSHSTSMQTTSSRSGNWHWVYDCFPTAGGGFDCSYSYRWVGDDIVVEGDYPDGYTEEEWYNLVYGGNSDGSYYQNGEYYTDGDEYYDDEIDEYYEMYGEYFEEQDDESIGGGDQGNSDSNNGYSKTIERATWGWIKTERFSSERALRDFITNYLLNKDGSAFLEGTFTIALGALATAIMGPIGGISVTVLEQVNNLAKDLETAHWKIALENGGIKIVETHNALRGTSIIEIKDAKNKTLTTMSYNYQTD